MRWRIEIKRSVAKEIRALPESVLSRVMRSIEALANEPRPRGVKKLSGSEKYRLRVGDYRIVYLIEEAIVTVVIVRVRHRKDVYR